jgi:glutaredoxin 3
MSSNKESIKFISNIISLNVEKVTFFSKDFCPYCDAAKNLLSKLHVKYQELNIDASDCPYDSADVRQHLVEGFDVRTFPQVFIGNLHIGGYDELRSVFKDRTLYSVLEENDVSFIRAGT